MALPYLFSRPITLVASKELIESQYSGLQATDYYSVCSALRKKATQEIEQYYRDIRLAKTDGLQDVDFLNSYVMHAKRIGKRCSVTDSVELTQRLAEFPTFKPSMLPSKGTLRSSNSQSEYS